MENEIIEIIASAIANARGMRRGVPSIRNVLDLLPAKLREEVMDDAKNVYHELKGTNVM
jgi:hypothetical protein